MRILVSAALDADVVTTAAATIGTGQSVDRLVVAPGNPLTRKDAEFSNSVVLSVAAGTAETGLFLDDRPNTDKTSRKLPLRSAIPANASIQATYRTAEDDASTGYTSLVTYTSAATARTGTSFPTGVTWKGVRLRFVLQADTSLTAYTYPALYNAQHQWLDYSPRL